MLKAVVGFIAGVIFVGVVGFNMADTMMLREVESPYGVEETAARIQRNIQGLSDNGWALSGLRNPAKAVANAGVNVPPVLLIEACSTKYSAPMLKDDDSRILSILMPCTITVYKKDDGKTYIGLMNSGLMGKMFGVGDIMAKVQEDQYKFVQFDDSKPAPPLIRQRAGGGGAGGGQSDDGC
ncbi:MAG: DUF302 domain-containing protein [Gammaproteobacteria bacterium]|nr:DUF302 domain-containing protein [Gammaproteobacteria bacterium]